MRGGRGRGRGDEGTMREGEVMRGGRGREEVVVGGRRRGGAVERKVGFKVKRTISRRL